MRDLKVCSTVQWLCAVSLLCSLCSTPAWAQGAGPNGVPPGMPKADPSVQAAAPAPPKVQALVGIWSIIKSPKVDPVPKQGFMPLTPAYEKRRAELERMDKAGDILPGRNSKCIPSGMPDMMTFGFNVFATADYLVVYGGYGTFRPVWLNRKTHTPSNRLFPTYQGESLGHWDGNTLVIDSVGFDPTNEITYALPVNDPDMHIVERWTLKNKNELEVVITIESKLALTKPYTYTMVYGRRPSSELVGEANYCDRPLVNGELDLTPPSGGYVPPEAKE